jgi:Lipocalin-like domain
MNRHQSDPAQLIVGAWQLISFEMQQPDGTVVHPFGPDAQGSIIYAASGRFAVQVSRRKRPLFASGDQIKGTQEEIEASFKGCIAYFGSYELDAEGGFVVHRVEGSLFPNWEGAELKRFFELAGDCLTLRTPATVWGGAGEVVGVLVWEKAR